MRIVHVLPSGDVCSCQPSATNSPLPNAIVRNRKLSSPPPPNRCASIHVLPRSSDLTRTPPYPTATNVGTVFAVAPSGAASASADEAASASVAGAASVVAADSDAASALDGDSGAASASRLVGAPVPAHPQTTNPIARPTR